MNAEKANSVAEENYKRLELEQSWKELALEPYREKVCRVKIQKAIEEGKFETKCDLSNSNVESLQKDGYKVKFVQHPLKWYHLVKW